MCKILPRDVSKTAARLQMMEKPPLVWGVPYLSGGVSYVMRWLLSPMFEMPPLVLRCCWDEWRKDTQSCCDCHRESKGCHAFAAQIRTGDSAAGWRAGAGWRCRRYPINERIASSCRCAACLPWIYRSRSLDASRSTCLTVTGFSGAMTSARPWRSYSQMCSRCSL